MDTSCLLLHICGLQSPGFGPSFAKELPCSRSPEARIMAFSWKTLSPLVRSRLTPLLSVTGVDCPIILSLTLKTNGSAGAAWLESVQGFPRKDPLCRQKVHPPSFQNQIISSRPSPVKTLGNEQRQPTVRLRGSSQIDAHARWRSYGRRMSQRTLSACVRFLSQEIFCFKRHLIA